MGTAAIVLGCVVVVNAGASDPEEPDPFAAMRSAVQVLETGRYEAKLLVAEDGWEGWDDLTGPEDERGRESQEIVESLRAAISAEEDDWIVSVFLENLLLSSGEGLQPVFRDALVHGSPSVRRRAYEYFQDEEAEPETLARLEKAFDGETRWWARVEAIRAIGYQGSANRLRELAVLARGKQLELALAAIEALGGIDDPGVVSALAAVAVGDGETVRREAALAGIERWGDDPRSVSAALEVSRDPEPRLRERALLALARSEDTRATERIVEVAFSGEILLRDIAARVLGAREHVLFPAALREILAHDRDALPSWISRRGDGQGGTVLVFDLDAESRDLPVPARVGRLAPRPEDDPVVCWTAPAGRGLDADAVRLDPTVTRSIVDYFEQDGALWLSVEPKGTSACWLPEESIDEIVLVTEDADLDDD